MIERPWYIDAKSAASLKARADQGEFTTLLGYNEPDNVVNNPVVTVAAGLAAWPLLESTGLRLGSPACGGNAARTWCPEFMAAAKAQGLRVDFVAVHWYGNPDETALFAEIDKAYSMWGLPVWVTEFGCVDWGYNPSRYQAADVVAFLQKVLPRLDATPYVERYAFYPWLDNESSYTNADGSMSDVAKVYDSHPFN